MDRCASASDRVGRPEGNWLRHGASAAAAVILACAMTLSIATINPAGAIEPVAETSEIAQEPAAASASCPSVSNPSTLSFGDAGARGHCDTPSDRFELGRHADRDPDLATWQVDSAERSLVDGGVSWSASSGGVEYRIGDDALVGLAVGQEAVQTRNGLTGDEEGQGVLFAPYLGVSPIDGVVVDVSAGVASFDAADPTGRRDLEAERWFVSTGVSGAMAYDRLRLAPSVGLVFSQGSVDGETADVTSGQGGDLGRLTLSGELGYQFDLENGGLIEPFVSVVGDWDLAGRGRLNITDSALIDEEAAGTTVGAGVNFDLGGAVSGQIGGSYDAVGREDPEAWSAEGRLRIAF